MVNTFQLPPKIDCAVLACKRTGLWFPKVKANATEATKKIATNPTIRNLFI
ncbi:hypothetical protein Mcup_0907 [Metallosphaera cuprina Ar-4]|uniref:Uncharacterized protein n=1 Tax=Metallosphaera cuprina (strain Ar-4) TaxID=1006006 RepID=F4G2G4_METCR|nr:hypothetical protein Mcup_0907 [Metallosphaera cuprina Ar-4]